MRRFVCSDSQQALRRLRDSSKPCARAGIRFLHRCSANYLTAEKEGWFILMPFPFPLWLWIGIALCLQLSWTMIITVADSLAADAASRTNKVAAMTAYTLAADVGAALGPSLGYMLTDLFNLSILYWFTSAVLIILSLMWFTRRKMFSSV